MGIALDYTNFLAESVGAEHGISDAELAAAAPRAAAAFEAVRAGRGQGWLGWTELPADRAGAEQCLALWAERAKRFDDFVVVGIGGSALGPLALKSALCHPFHDLLPAGRRPGARLHVLDNADPARCAGLLETLDLRRTLFNVITKSGGTAETASQFLAARAAVEQAVGRSWREHFVFTTDPAKGDLRRLAKEEGIAALEVPPGVGGRFSVLCSVGLFPAAALGIDVRGLLSGAAAADRQCASPDWQQNPALALAALLWLLDTAKGKRIHVLMPYASALADVADWFRQLWAESLGKKVTLDGRPCAVGPTPVKSLGATDQHSQVQLYTEGPNDKAVVFVSVGEYPREVKIPQAYPELGAFNYLAGHGIGELLDAERRGTELALTAAGRPNATLGIERIDAGTVGGLMFLWELATAYAGRLYNVDAFDQPGVEAGKVAAYALLGHPQYAEERARIEKARAGIKRRTVG